MADKGRDLRVAVLSDADRFDLAKPAADLENLGDKAGTTAGELNDLAREASDAGRDLEDLSRSSSSLERVGDDAKAAGDDVDKMAGDVDQAASRVDASFDKIAAASKRGGQDVERASRKGADSVQEMGDEGRDTAREMAASFDGTADGIQDAMQEAATNVLAVLGPVGAAVGVAGGLAIGWLRGQGEAAREEISGLVSAIVDAGGRIDNAGVIAKIREFAEDGSITDLAREARGAKVPVSDYLRALAGDPDALERTRGAIDANRQAIDANREAAREAGTVTVESAQANSDQVIALSNMSDNLAESADKYALATEAAKTFQDAVDPNQEAIDSLGASLESFTGPVGAYEDALATATEAERDKAEKTAAATKSQSDSWEDYVDDVAVSVDDYLDELERQVTAQEDWAENLGALARRGVDEGVLASLAELGPRGAPLVAEFATASDAELARLQDLFARRGAASGTDYAAGLLGQRPEVAASGQAIWTTARDKLSPEIRVPVGVRPPTPGTLAGVNSGIRAGIGTVTVPLMLQRVTQSIWSTQRPIP